MLVGHLPPDSTVLSSEDLPISFPPSPAFLLDEVTYTSFPQRLAIQYSPDTNENPYGILPQFYFAHSHATGAASESHMDHASIKLTLTRCSRGDRVVVTRSNPAAHVVQSIGVLTQLHQGTWHVAYDNGGDQPEYSTIPADGVVYFDVSLSVPTIGSFGSAAKGKKATSDKSPSPTGTKPQAKKPAVTNPNKAPTSSATKQPKKGPSATTSAAKPAAKKAPPKKKVAPKAKQAPQKATPSPKASKKTLAIPAAPAQVGLPDEASMPVDEVVMDPSRRSPEITALYKAFEDSKNVHSPGTVLEKVSGESMTASQLLEILQQDQTKIAPCYRHLLAWSTSQKHLRTLRWLRDNLSRSSDPLDLAIPRCVQLIASVRSWKASSWHNKLVTIQGALALLFISRSIQVSVVLARCPRWGACVTSVAHLMPLDQPKQPMAITEAQMKMAISLEPRPMVKAAIGGVGRLNFCLLLHICDACVSEKREKKAYQGRKKNPKVPFVTHLLRIC